MRSDFIGSCREKQFSYTCLHEISEQGASGTNRKLFLYALSQLIEYRTPNTFWTLIRAVFRLLCLRRNQYIVVVILSIHFRKMN